MKLTANFTLDELIKSQVAERKGINNNPSPEQIENLKALAVKYLLLMLLNFLFVLETGYYLCPYVRPLGF